MNNHLNLFSLTFPERIGTSAHGGAGRPRGRRTHSALSPRAGGRRDCRLPHGFTRGGALRTRARGQATAGSQCRPERPGVKRLHATAHRLQEE